MSTIKVIAKNKSDAAEVSRQIIKALLFNDEVEVILTPRRTSSFIEGLPADVVAYIERNA